MASSPRYDPDAPHRHVAASQGVHSGLLLPDYRHPDAAPGHFVSRRAPIAVARDMRPVTGRARRSRRYAGREPRLQAAAPTSQGSAAARQHAASRQRRSRSLVYFVPDPPTRASQGRNGGPVVKKTSSERRLDSARPFQAHALEGHYYPAEMQCWAACYPSASPPPPQYHQYTSGLRRPATGRTPPPTPRIPREPTPEDLKPLDACRPFCDCHPDRGGRASDNGRRKTELQCKSRHLFRRLVRERAD